MSELQYYKTELNNFNTETPIDIYLKILLTVEKNVNDQKKDLENKLRHAMEDMKKKILNSNIRINNGTKIYDPTTDGYLQAGMIVDIMEPKETKSIFKTTEQFSERNSERRKQNNTRIMPILNTITTGNLDYINATNNNGKNKQTNKISTNNSTNNLTNIDDTTNINKFKNNEYGQWKYNCIVSTNSNGILTFENDDKQYTIDDCIIAIKENNKSEVIDKIKLIIDENRGLANTGHTDITPAIIYFVQEFAKDCTSILYEFLGIVNNIMIKYVDDIFNINVESYLMRVLDKKKQDIINEIICNKQKLSERIYDLVRSNMGNTIYTSNEHKLTSAYNEMTKNKSFDGENGLLEHIYFRIKAYLNCKKDYVIENATVNTSLLLYTDSIDNIKKNMHTNLKEYSESIEFPLERQLRMNELNKYIDTTTQILQLL